MAKTKAQKEAEVKAFTDVLKGSSAVAFAELVGMKVADESAFRRKAEAEGVRVRMAKKTLLTRAIADSGLDGIDATAFEGKAVTMLQTEGDQIAPAKLLSEVLKAHEGMAALGGLLDGAWMSADEVTALAKLPSREELLAKIVGSLSAPLRGTVGVLQGNLRNLVYALHAIQETK